MAAPTLDGTATGQSSSSTTTAATLTTSLTNDIICALVAVETGSGTMPYVTGIADTASLTWNKRSGVAQTIPSVPGAPGNGACSIDLWWAVSSGALTSDVITATFNTSCDDSAILVFGVNGCNTAQPWDNNPTVPSILPWTGNNTPSFANISTSTANTFQIFAMADNAGTGSIGTVPTGFSTLGFHENGGGSLFCTVGAAYQQLTSTVSNQTYTWGSAWSRPYSLFDALTADTCTLNPVPQIEVANAHNSTGTTNTVIIASPSTTSTIVIVSYGQQSGGGSSIAITSVSGGSLTWTLRGVSDSSHRGRIEVWTAPVTSGLAPTTATVTYAAALDSGTIATFTLLNCSSAIFDSNGGLPAVLSNTSSTVAWTPSISGVSTSQATDLIFAIVGTAWFTGTGQETAPTNFNMLLTAQNTAGALGDNLGIAIMPVGTAQSSQTYAWGAAVTDDSSTNAGGEFYIDAFTSASGSTNDNVNVSGVAGTGEAGTVTFSGFSTGLASGGLLREVLETRTGVAYSAGLVREVLSTTTAHLVVEGLAREVLVATHAHLIVGGVAREVLRAASDVPVNPPLIAFIM